MNIGEVSKKLNMTKKALYLYEDKGLIVPEKKSNGYRNYTQEDMNILYKIKILRALDFSLVQIEKILKENDQTVFKDKYQELKINEQDILKKWQYLDYIKESLMNDDLSQCEKIINELTNEDEKHENLFIDFDRLFLKILLIFNMPIMFFIDDAIFEKIPFFGVIYFSFCIFCIVYLYCPQIISPYNFYKFYERIGRKRR